MQFQLNIKIDEAGVNQINDAGQFVTIVKSVQQGNNNNPIAWVAFAPFMDNAITWEQQYRIYATTTQLTGGAKIVMTSQTSQPVQFSKKYVFSGGTFSGDAGGVEDAFLTENQFGGPLTFGLAQTAIVNNVNVSAPLNAVRVGNNQTAQFTPQEKVSIFLGSTNDNGVVLTTIAGDALAVTLTSQASVANIGFNNSNNTFYLSSASNQIDRTPLHQRVLALTRR